jgi:hypothetical protein
MAATRTAVLHKAKVATTEPRNLTGAPEFIHGIGIRNWEVANITNKIETLLKIITTEASVRGSLIGELESVRHRLGFGHARRLADIVQSPTWSELVYLEAKKYETDFIYGTEHRMSQPRIGDSHSMDGLHCSGVYDAISDLEVANLYHYVLSWLNRLGQEKRLWFRNPVIIYYYYHWLKDQKLAWASQLCQFDGSIRPSIATAAKSNTSLARVISNLFSDNKIKQELGDYIWGAPLTGFFQIIPATTQTSQIFPEIV